MDLNTFNNDTNNAAFDSRNDHFDIWDSCLPCNETSIRFGPLAEKAPTLSNDSGPTLQKDHDSLVADAVKSLSMKERDHAFHDIHGVADIQEEKEDFIEEELHLLDIELDKIKSKRAYFIAKSISENYVSNSKFRLKFLRAENYNVKNAAIRIVRHFETKLELFGKEKLTKDITLSDLTEEDIFYMKTGFLQICAEKDRSGRSIICTDGELAYHTPIEPRRRVIWYIYNTAAEDEVTQRKGAVWIVLNYGTRPMNPEATKKVHPMIKAHPVRLSAIHMCPDNRQRNILSIRPFYAVVHSVLGKSLLGRMRLHYSSRLETIYTLMTFGIPRTVFGADGEINTSIVLDFIKKRMAEERERALSNRLFVPNRYDVLLGKGKRVLGSPGNLHCREIMETYRNEYEQGSRSQKANITRHVFKQIKSKGGRFLKEGESGWAEIDDEAAKKKISHDFRNLRR